MMGIIYLGHLTDDARSRHRTASVNCMLAVFIDRAQAVIGMAYEFIGLYSKEHQRLKVRREHINNMCAEHNGLRLRQSYEAAECAVVELKTLGREFRFFIRKFFTRTLDKNLKQLIESIVAGFENARDNILGRLIETLRQTLLFDLISSIVDVAIESHTHIIMIYGVFVLYFCLTKGN